MMKRCDAIDKDNSDPGPGVPSKISFSDNDNHVSPLGSGSILASAPGSAANKRADLRRLFVKSLSWASSLTSSSLEGNDNEDSPKGNQSQTYTRTVARNPPPPPPRRGRSASSSWRKQRSHLTHLHPSSTTDDPEHSLLRRWSEGSRDTCATEDEEELVRMMPGTEMKLEQSDRFAKDEENMNTSFHSFMSSSKKKKSHELVVTFDDESPKTKTLDRNKITSSANIANTEANKRADLRRLFVKSVSWASSLTSSPEGNENSPEGNRSHSRTVASARNPPPPPPQWRSTSPSRRKQRANPMNTSSFSEDPEHSLLRRWSKGSRDTHAIEDEKEHVRRMSGMKLEQSHCSTEEGQMNASFHSFMSSSKKKKSHDLVVTFDEESPMTLNRNKITSSANVARTEDNTRADRRRLFFKSASWASSLTSSSEAEGDEDRPRGNQSSSMFDRKNKRSYIQRPVRVSQFEDKSPSPSKPCVSSAPQDCDKHGRCKLHPQYKLYEKKFLVFGGYEFIRNCPICTLRNYIPTSAKIRAESVEQQHHSDSREERLRRSRAHSPDISPGFNRNYRSRISFASALKSIHQKLPTHKSSRRRHRSHWHSRDYSRLSSSSRGHSMDEAMGFEKDMSIIEKGDHGRDKDKTPQMATFETSKEPSYQVNKKNLGSNEFVHESSKVSFDTKTGRCKKHPSVVLAKKSTFRPNSWEIIKNGCPFCSGAQVESNLNEATQRPVEGTKKERGLSSLKDGVDSGGSIARMSKKKTRPNKISSSRRGSSSSGNSTQSNHYSRASASAPSEGSQVEKVFRLPYTTPLRESGWYTGEVDSDGRPHGYGRMRFKVGHTYEGKWSHGYAYGEGQREKLNRMKSGFGSNKAAWRESEMAPSVQNTTAPSLAGAGRVNTPNAAQAMPRQGVMHQSQQQPQPRQEYFLAQMQQAQQQVLQQQAWIDMTPQERQRSMTDWYAIWLSDSGYRPT